MNIHTLRLDESSTLHISRINPNGRRDRWAMAYGMRYQSNGESHRMVTLSLRAGSIAADCDFTEYRHASLDMNPDEARALAARLLDAADDADARSDDELPVQYDLTPKGREVLA